LSVAGEIATLGHNRIEGLIVVFNYNRDTYASDELCMLADSLRLGPAYQLAQSSLPDIAI
jgi:hypothetical protein